MLYIDICSILALSLLITDVGRTKTKQLIFFAILLMLEFILNILRDVIHDVFTKHVYDTVREKNRLIAYSVMYSPSLNLKTGLPIAWT